MKLEELLKTIEESDASEWTVFDRPTFAQDIQQVSGGLHQVPWVEVHEHHSLLSYRSDLRISIALGLTHRADFVEDWTQLFPDNTLLHLGSISDTMAFRFIARSEFSLTAEGRVCHVRLRGRRTSLSANTTFGGSSMNLSDQNKWTIVSSALS